jgi:hypothetical protein
VAGENQFCIWKECGERGFPIILLDVWGVIIPPNILGTPSFIMPMVDSEQSF